MKWWWLVTINDKGRRVVIGPFMSEYLAQIEADKLDRQYEIVELDTKNKYKASSQIKAMEIMKTGDVDKGTSRSVIDKVIRKR